MPRIAVRWSPPRGLSPAYDMIKPDPAETHRMTTLPLRPALEARPGPRPSPIAGEFLRFGVVGCLGFLVDALVLLAGLALGLGPWLGRLVSYVAAASTTYALNHAWTFRGRAGGRPEARQWALFLLVNLSGFAVNFGTYAAAITLIPLASAQPVLAVAAGSIAGLAVNFTLSRQIVFAARLRVAPVAER